MSMDDRNIESFFNKQELPQENMPVTNESFMMAMCISGIHSIIATENHKMYENILRNDNLTGAHIFHIYRYSPKSCVILQDILKKLYDEEFSLYIKIIRKIMTADHVLSSIILSKQEDNIDTFLIKKFMLDMQVSPNQKELIVEDVLNNEDLIRFLFKINPQITFITLVRKFLSLGCCESSVFAEDAVVNLDTLITTSFLSSMNKNIKDFIVENRPIFEAIFDADKSVNNVTDIAYAFASYQTSKYIDGPLMRLYKSYYLAGIVDEINSTIKRFEDNGSIDFTSLSTPYGLYVFDYIALTIILLRDGSKNTELTFILDEYDLVAIKEIYQYMNDEIFDLYEFWDKETTVSDIEEKDIEMSAEDFINILY